ncbi:hypothetical protein [Actinomadura sp. 9N407]
MQTAGFPVDRLWLLATAELAGAAVFAADLPDRFTAVAAVA